MTCCAVSAVAFSTASLGTSVRRDGALKSALHSCARGAAPVLAVCLFSAPIGFDADDLDRPVLGGCTNATRWEESSCRTALHFDPGPMRGSPAGMRRHSHRPQRKVPAAVPGRGPLHRSHSGADRHRLRIPRRGFKMVFTAKDPLVLGPPLTPQRHGQCRHRSTSPPAANAVTIRPVAVLSYALGNRFKAFLAGVGVTSILQSSELQRNF